MTRNNLAEKFQNIVIDKGNFNKQSVTIKDICFRKIN